MVNPKGSKSKAEDQYSSEENDQALSGDDSGSDAAGDDYLSLSKKRKSEDHSSGAGSPKKQKAALTAFVGNLPYSAEADQVERIFKSCGPIADVRILKNSDGYSKGIAFVDFEDEEGLLAALKLNDSDFEGRSLKVEKTEPRQPRDGGSFGGRGGARGGRGGRGGSSGGGSGCFNCGGEGHISRDCSEPRSGGRGGGGGRGGRGMRGGRGGGGGGGDGCFKCGEQGHFSRECPSGGGGDGGFRRGGRGGGRGGFRRDRD